MKGKTYLSLLIVGVAACSVSRRETLDGLGDLLVLQALGRAPDDVEVADPVFLSH